MRSWSTARCLVGVSAPGLFKALKKAKPVLSLKDEQDLRRCEGELRFAVLLALSVHTQLDAVCLCDLSLRDRLAMLHALQVHC